MSWEQQEDKSINKLFNINKWSKMSICKNMPNTWKWSISIINAILEKKLHNKDSDYNKISVHGKKRMKKDSKSWIIISTMKIWKEWTEKESKKSWNLKVKIIGTQAKMLKKD